MLAQSSGAPLELLWAAVVTGVSAIVVALVNNVRIGRVGREATKAAGSSARAETRASEAAEQVRPENGTRSGVLLEEASRRIEQVGRLLEVIDGRLHDVSKRVDAQGREVGDIRRHTLSIEGQLQAHGQALTEVRRGLATHLDEVTPLVAEFVATREERDRGDAPEGR